MPHTVLHAHTDTFLTLIYFLDQIIPIITPISEVTLLLMYMNLIGGIYYCQLSSATFFLTMGVNQSPWSKPTKTEEKHTNIQNRKAQLNQNPSEPFSLNITALMSQIPKRAVPITLFLGGVILCHLGLPT